MLFASIGMAAQQYTVTISSPTSSNTAPQKFYTVAPNSCTATSWTLVPGVAGTPIYMSNTSYPSGSYPCSLTSYATVQVWNKFINNNTQSSSPLIPGTYQTITDFQYGPLNLDLIGKAFLYRYDNSNGSYYSITFGSSNLSTPHFEKDFSIYPNPVSDILHVETELDAKYEIYDITGNLLVSSSSKDIDISFFASGVYLLRISSDDRQCIKKIIKS